MAQWTPEISTYQVQCYVFHLSPVVDGQTDAALTYAGPVAAITPKMPWAGSVIAIEADMSAAVGAGALSFDVAIATVQQDIDLTIAVDGTRVKGEYREGTYRFAEGDALVATYTSGTLTTNGNVTVYVYVLFENVRP